VEEAGVSALVGVKGQMQSDLDRLPRGIRAWHGPHEELDLVMGHGLPLCDVKAVQLELE
jgi:hypothetical protein